MSRWDVAPACTVVTQAYGCVDYSGEWGCPACGPATGYFHAGIDLGGDPALTFRSPVLATRSGVVSAVGVQYLGDQAVAVKTDEGVTIEHGHLDQATVSVGRRVNVGDQLGLLGTKGQSTGPHLHLEVRVDGPFQGVGGCPDNDPTRNPIPYLMKAKGMIAGLDSSFFRPSAAQVLRAREAGVRLWSGYLASRPGVGIASPWGQADFDRARLCGGTPIAWASGWDDPVACRRIADAWNVRLGVDVEGSGLRADGPWVQGWIDAAGRDRTGLYGNYWVFQHNFVAGFYVVGGYPGSDPQATWGYTARPSAPCGWQWQGSHDEFGGSVDRGWYDDWFLGVAGPSSPPIPPGGGMIAYDPSSPSDVYQVAIGTDGRFYARKGWDQGLADLNWLDLSGSAAPSFAAQSASIAVKPDGAFYVLEALGLDGSVWSSVRAYDGKVLQDWKANLGKAALPGGAPGPAGPAYDDAELRGDVQELKDRVAQVARVLS